LNSIFNKDRENFAKHRGISKSEERGEGLSPPAPP